MAHEAEPRLRVPHDVRAAARTALPPDGGRPPDDVDEARVDRRRRRRQQHLGLVRHSLLRRWLHWKTFQARTAKNM